MLNRSIHTRRVVASLTAVALVGFAPAAAAGADHPERAADAGATRPAGADGTDVAERAKLGYRTVAKRGGVKWQMCVRQVDWQTRIQFRLNPAKPKGYGTILLKIDSGGQNTEFFQAFGRGYQRVKPSYSSSWPYLDSTQVKVVLKVRGAGKAKRTLLGSQLPAC